MAQNYSGKIGGNAIAPGFFIGEQNRFLMIDKEAGGWTARGQRVIEHTPWATLAFPKLHHPQHGLSSAYPLRNPTEPIFTRQLG